MSRFFEFLKKINGETSEPVSEAVRGKAQDVPEAWQILSVLHPQQNGGQSRYGEPIFQLNQVGFEEVHLAKETRLVFHTDPSGTAADRFRLLRMHLQSLQAAERLKSLLITSAHSEEGKSTIALNLATALAEGGKHKVLLIEADFYHSRLQKRLGLQARSGLAECLESGMDAISAVRRLEPLHWYLLSAGEPRGIPTELLQSDLLSRVFQRLSPYFDWILIDTPPVVPLTDALLISQHADASLLVVRADRTPREAVEEALKLLRPKRVLGVVLNASEGLNRRYSQYSEYSGKTR